MEATTTTAPAGRAVDASTVTEALRRTAAEHADLVAFRTRDDGVSLTWAQFAERVEALAGGLAALGVGRGDFCDRVPKARMIQRQLGGAVNGKPAKRVDTQISAGKERDKGAQGDAIGERQEKRGDAISEAQSEAQQGDFRIMIEQ